MFIFVITLRGIEVVVMIGLGEPLSSFCLTLVSGQAPTFSKVIIIHFNSY